MRKRIISHGPREVAAAEPGWLDLERLAQVEITSEDLDHPIESALIPGTGIGWQAAQPGEQTIRLLFNEPLRLTRIHLVFHEGERERTQEFVLRWSSDGGQSYREIV
ncbi:MAG: carbohydrate-binding protein, partial [Deltaproteobacteria bacterium]|nr:carbohydrate-binding protein [Deltaproteobacteria bacterium]